MNRDGRRVRISGDERETKRRELDETLTAFRVVQRNCGSRPEGWLRAMRHAIGLPLTEIARRLQVTKRNVVGLEQSEQAGRILLDTLERTAEAMDCVLVYALVPREGTLEEIRLQREEEEERKRAAAAARSKTPEGRKAAAAAMRATLVKARIKF
jgi:predicted DNA-binding mobile mystery protein A